jgi:hypothetical protein
MPQKSPPRQQQEAPQKPAQQQQPQKQPPARSGILQKIVGLFKKE